eukprot:3165832-Lingulodinium_polyedra.AAC.1
MHRHLGVAPRADDITMLHGVGVDDVPCVPAHNAILEVFRVPSTAWPGTAIGPCNIVLGRLGERVGN